MINVRDMGGVTDTERVQRALDLFSARPDCGGLYFAAGIAEINDTLTFRGTGGRAIRLQGEVGGSLAGLDTVLKWTGAVGGKLLDLPGLNGATIENLTFDANYKAKTAVHVRWDVDGSTHYASGHVWRRCVFANAVGSGSALVQYGDSTTGSVQVDEACFYDCEFLGSSVTVGDTESGFMTGAGGNVLGFRFVNCHILRVKRGLKCASNGPIVFIGGSVSDALVASFDAGDCELLVSGVRTENVNAACGQFVYASGAGSVKVEGCEVIVKTPANDAIITCSGALLLDGNFFEQLNSSDAVIPPRIQVGNPAAGGSGSVFSRGNNYAGWAPGEKLFVDGSNNDLLDSYTAQSSAHSVVSLNDRGQVGSTIHQVPATFGTIPTMPQLGPVSLASGTGIAKEYAGQSRHVAMKVTVGYQALQGPSGNVMLRLDAIQPRQRVVAVYADTTTGFAGAGAVTLSVGIGSFGQHALVSHSVTSPVVSGLAGGDLGTGLASPVQGAWVPSWTAASDLFATFTNGGTAAFSGLTAGSTTFWVVKEVLG